MLSKPPVINGLVGILLNSADPLVLKATIFLLSELGSRDKGVIHTLTRADSDVERIVALFKKGLLEAIVLIYLLRPSTMNLLEMDMVESLLTVIKKKEDDMLKMCLKPKTTAVLLLGQIFASSEDSIISSIANAIISTKVIENMIDSLQAEQTERIAAVGILLKCMLEDGKCRNTVAEKAELAPVLDSFLSASDGERFEIVQFLYEIVKLNRRTFNEQILHIIKDGGTFSTTHIFLNYLQAEPRKMSIYREEAIESLISSLRNSEFPAAQIAAAETIVSLQGRFTVSGKSLTRSFLLKQAGLGKPYKNLMRMEQPGKLSGEVEENLEEERAAEEWERRMAFALVSYDFGLLFEALAEGLRSRCTELRSACFVSATWLVHMLGILPDTGIRSAARVCFLKLLIEIFTSSEDIENKVLSLLALNSFIKDPEGLHDLTSSMKDIKKDLRELRKSSSLAFEILKVLSAGHDSSTAELWTHNELVQVDCSENGEVLSIAFYNDKIFSGHSDGTIKVWTGKGSILHLIQEIREHTKAVTSLAVLQSGEKLYSGSLDRTERVWSVGNESLTCVHVHDMKDQVNNLVVANGISCFIPQGAGIKVHSWNGGSKLLNPNKHVKCLSLAHGKLYCGCHDSSIQEIDLTTGAVATIQHGSRKLLGKANPIHAIQVQNGLVYSASSPLDGAAVKIWNASNYDLVGSLPSLLEVRCMAISSDLIYMGCKAGSVEIWDRKKQQSRVEILQTGTNDKVLCMALNANEDVLVIGTSTGQIQAWANETFEKVAGVGLHANMILYLRNEYNLSSASGAYILSLWGAISNFMPVLGALLSDSYLGRFRVIASATLISLLGITVLWLTAFIPNARPPHCALTKENMQACVSPNRGQLFFCFPPSLYYPWGPVASDHVHQIDDPENPENQKTLQTFFNWYYASVGISVMFSVLAIVAIQDVAGWVVGFGVPVGFMLSSTIFFFLGSSRYIKVKANKSLVTGFVQVIVATWKNRNLALHQWILPHGTITRVPSWWHRQKNLGTSLRLCTIKQVEEQKGLIRVIPIWSTGIVIAATLNQHALPVLQASTMDRHLVGILRIPAGSYGVFGLLTLFLWVAIYDRKLVPLLAKLTGRPRGLSNEQRMGIGILISCIATATAGVVENKRRATALRQGLADHPRAVVDMSANWLLPQHCLVGLAEALSTIGQIDFFYSQFPKSMKSIAMALLALSAAAGDLVASLIIGIVNDVTKRGGRVSWLSNNLNKGHYDYYYWLLSLLNVANLFYYLLCSRAFGNEDEKEYDDGEAMEEKYF
uniref:Uncharacterized protein n=1 Tax=Salix viminalis TaxID=40686 RepID=A0A6N2KKZ7_SALVM